MQLSSLDMAMQRIGAIENRIQSLNSLVQAPDSDFQKILNSKIDAKSNPTKTSRTNIDNLISKYADKNLIEQEKFAWEKSASEKYAKNCSNCNARVWWRIASGL